MQTQIQLLKAYRDLYGSISFRQISEQTGIQQTRVFRIFNGHEMRVKEFDIFKKLITIKGEKHSKLFLCLQEASQKLSNEYLMSLERELERKLELWNLQNEIQIEQNLAA